MKSTISSHRALTAEGVKDSPVLNSAPLVRSHRISATNPAPTSKTLPDASGPSGCVRAATRGTTYSGYGVQCQRTLRLEHE